MLFRLHLDDQLVGGELLADSDEHAREVAADLQSEALHRSPDAYLVRRVDNEWVPIADSSPIAPLHPPTPQTGPSPGPGERHPMVPVKLYEHDAARHRFGELAESLGQVELAIRQLARAQTAHRVEQTRRMELGFVEGLVPDELVALEVERDDAMEFAIIAARRAVGAHHYLTSKRNLTLPELRQQEKVWALRDLYEHWHEWKVEERGSFASDNRWLKTKKAGSRWAEASGGHRPMGSMAFSAAPPPDMVDPNGRITAWNSIDIDQLTDDLETLRAAIAKHRQRAFEWELLDQEAAVELVGPTMWMLIGWFTNLRGRRAVDGVVRWERAWLLAADRAIRERRWIINGQVVGPLDEQTAEGE